MIQEEIIESLASLSPSNMTKEQVTELIMEAREQQQQSQLFDSKYSFGMNQKWDGDQQIDYVSFIDAFNDLYGQQIRVTDNKRKNIRSRLRTFTGAEIKQAWLNRLEDEFLNGQGRKHLGNWKAAMRNDEKIDRYLNMDNSPQKKHRTVSTSIV